jgi:hypothetical protein
MKKLLVSAALLCLSPFVFAQASPADCEAKAVSKNGKPLAGAAKTAFMKKCTGGAQAPAAKANAAAGCEAKAVDKNGKPLAGAAKGTFMKKCEKNAQAAK